MAESYGYVDSFKAHRESQNKFEYFFLAVILGILSISVQSFNPTNMMHSNWLMLGTWLLLIVSFLSGFFIRERTNMVTYIETEKLGQINRQAPFIQSLQPGGIPLLKPDGTPWSIEDTQGKISEFNILLSSADRIMKFHEDHLLKAYQIQKWCFLFAIVMFGLYKISNMYSLSVGIEIAILVLIALLGRVIIVSYKKSYPITKTFGDKDE